MTTPRTPFSRRTLLKGILAAGAAPFFVRASALGADGRPAPSNRLALGCIGVGGRGTSDMKTFLSFPEVQVVAVCDVVQGHRERAKGVVDKQYGTTACAAVNDFRDVIRRPDVDIILCGTPDHWHAIVSIEAMRQGKDVFCEKPETLTIRQGRRIADEVRRLGRVFSGGSQRVWEDYNWFHKMVRGGQIGDVREVYVNVGQPSKECDLPAEPVPAGVDWNLWLGPAPWEPFNGRRLNFRAWRDYSGGSMTDWGAHCFGGALFCCQLHHTGPVKITPPDGKDHPYLTYEFANGIKFYHSNKYKGRLHVVGSKREIPAVDGERLRPMERAPAIQIENYKGGGGLVGDFLYGVRTRQEPFRNIEVAHRAVTVCHLGNIAYWLNRPIRWDPVKEEIVGDPEAARWLDRPMRSPWRI